MLDSGARFGSGDASHSVWVASLGFAHVLDDRDELAHNGFVGLAFRSLRL